MSDDKAILVIRAKKHLSKQKLKDFQKLWSKQINDGLVLIPDDFEFVSLDPETLKPCEFEYQQIKKESWWRKLLRRFRKG